MPAPGTTSTIASVADMQVSADDTPISNPSSASDKDGEKCTASPSLAKTTSKTSDISEPPDCPVKFENLEDFFSQVGGQIKRAQSLSTSADRSSSMHGKITDTKKSPQETLATAKDDIERLLKMPSQDLLLPENCSTLSAALLIYAAAPDLLVERELSMKKLNENLSYLCSTFHNAKKDQEEYYRMTAMKFLFVNELTKGQELYTNLKDHNDKLECTMNSIRNQISKLTESFEDAKTKTKAIQEQQLSLAKKCFETSTALDEMEAEFHGLEEMKEQADSDISRVEASLRDLKE